MLAFSIAQGKCLHYSRFLYFRFKEEIFSGNRPYSTEALEKLLREELGEHRVMADLKGIR